MLNNRLAIPAAALAGGALATAAILAGSQLRTETPPAPASMPSVATVSTTPSPSSEPKRTHGQDPARRSPTVDLIKVTEAPSARVRVEGKEKTQRPARPRRVESTPAVRKIRTPAGVAKPVSSTPTTPEPRRPHCASVHGTWEQIQKPSGEWICPPDPHKTPPPAKEEVAPPAEKVETP